MDLNLFQYYISLHFFYLNSQRHKDMAHEAFHIVEYELYDQTHKGEEVNFD